MCQIKATLFILCIYTDSYVGIYVSPKSHTWIAGPKKKRVWVQNIEPNLWEIYLTA